MKKLIAALLVLTMVLAFAGCAKAPAPVETAAPTVEAAPTEAAPATEAPVETEAAPPAVMSYEEYMAAELDAVVTIETYVQANQSWWDGKITLYCQSPDGAYFLYNTTCTEEDAAKLVPGTKIRVTGGKASYEGEVEIMEGSMEILEGDTFLAEAADLTDMLGSDALVVHQNEKAAFKGLTVEPIQNADGEEFAFLYNWDGSGEQGNDLYFNVSVNGEVYNFTVESYLCGADTEVYKAVEALKVGDVIDCEGFLYWYQGPNPHITSVTPAA